jgi:hypothetical protein
VDDGSADRSAQMIADAADMPGSHVVGVLLNETLRIGFSSSISGSRKVA